MVFCDSKIAAEFTMRFSHQFPPTHHTAQNLEQCAKDVKAATKGRVEVQHFGAAQLLKPNQNHAAGAPAHAGTIRFVSQESSKSRDKFGLECA